MRKKIKMEDVQGITFTKVKRLLMYCNAGRITAENERSVTIQMTSTEQYFPMVLWLCQ